MSKIPVKNSSVDRNSQFIAQFGDPLSNPNGWPIEPLKGLTTKIGTGATPKGGNASYVAEGTSLIRSMNVYNGYFLYDDLAHITPVQAAALDGVTVEKHDVLLNITGASVARCCIVPQNILPARVNQHVCILRCKPHIIDPIFLNQQLISSSYQKILWDMAEAGGGTRQALTKQQVEELRIIVPPFSQQTMFAEFIQQSDKSKFAALSVSNLNLSLCLAMPQSTNVVGLL